MTDTGELGSTIIRRDHLDELQVFMHIDSNGGYMLCPLDKVLHAAESIKGDSHDVILMPSTILDKSGVLVVDHLSKVQPGTVVSFHVVGGGGRIQSRAYTITEEGKLAIEIVRKTVALVV